MDKVRLIELRVVIENFLIFTVFFHLTQGLIEGFDKLWRYASFVNMKNAGAE